MSKGTTVHDVIQTEQKIKKLQEQLAGLSNKNAEHEELLTIIHRPGWTTLAEIAFVDGILDSMQKHVETVAHLHQVLMSGSRAVGSK